MNKNRKISGIILQLVLLLFSMVYLIPAWMILVNSFKPYKFASKFNIGFSEGMSINNYIEVFKAINIPRAFMNAAIIAGFTIVFAALLSSMGAFIIARSKSRFSNSVYYLYFSMLIVPSAPIPTYLILKYIGALDTYHGLIIVFTTLCIPFNTFFYTGFVKTIPREMDNAAIIDGCGQTRMFFSIIFPLLKASTVTLLVFNFMGIWNDLQTYLYLASPNKWVLPMTVYKFIGDYNTQWNYVFAHLMICILPVLIAYLAAQKHIVSGLTAGAVKA